MKHAVRPSIVALAALLLTACGAGGASVETSASQVAPEPTTVATGAFGTAVKVNKTVSVTLSNMQEFTPSPYTTGWMEGDKTVSFDVTVQNSGAQEILPSSLALSSSAGDVSCVDVFDGDSKLAGAPAEAVPAGGSVTFPWGIDCSTAKTGDALSIALSFDGATEVRVDGKLV